MVIAVATWAAAAPTAAQMVIDSVIITSGPAYAAGTFTDFFIDPEVQGSGIAAITFSTQSGLTANLVHDGNGTWECDEVLPTGPCENFTSLSQINALGNLTFSFLGTLSELDTITVPDADYDPGSGQSGFPHITAPTPGEVGVSLSPTFTWNAAPGWVNAIFAAVEVTATGAAIDEELITTPSTTAWMPSGLPAGTEQDFRLSFLDVYFLDDPRTSSGSRSYLFSSGFEAFNFVSFTTLGAVPIAGWVSGLVSLGLGCAGALALRRGRTRGGTPGR
jgi:hypothetical protein